MKKIVIIGGGYGGVSTLRRLAGRKDISITLIDQHPYHFLQTEGYELVAGTLPFDQSFVNLHTLCSSYGEHVTFLHAKVDSIEVDEGKIYYHDRHELVYDFLIIAAGSVTRFISSIEGLRSCSHGVKSLTGAFRMKQFFENELFLRLENDKHAKEHYSVVIGGAGLSGVEIAAQMQHYFNRYYKSNTLACATLQIHLIAGGHSVLKGMHTKIMAKAEERLNDLGVIIHKGAHIESVEPHCACLEGGKKLDFDFMIFTGGIMASPLIANLHLDTNKLGQIIVNKYLQLPDHPEIFAIGDVAEIRDGRGKLIPDTAQVAIKSGQCAAENIRCLLEGKSPKEAKISIKGLAIALGGRYAIIDLKWIRIYGIVGYFTKQLVESLYKWPLWLRCRIGFQKTRSCQI